MKRIRAAIGALLVLVPLAACGTTDDATAPSASASSSAPKVAALFTQFVDQGNWDVAGYAAYKDMCTTYTFDCTYVEEATYEQAPALLRQYAEQGYKLIIAHSSGYASAMKEAAAEFPDTQFALFSYESDTEGLANYSAWSVDWDQVGYLEGAVAGLASSTGKIAAVGGEQLPSTQRSFAVMEAGAQSVNPTATVAQTWIGSFTDVAKGKQVAAQAVSDGADFLIPSADLAGQGVQQASEAAGTLSLGEYMDESDKYPNSVITSVTIDFATSYDEIGKDLVDGTLGNKLVQLGASTGTIGLAPFHHVPDTVATRAAQILAGLADGSITVPAVG